MKRKRALKFNNKRRMTPEAKARAKHERWLERKHAPVREVSNGSHGTMRFLMPHADQKPLGPGDAYTDPTMQVHPQPPAEMCGPYDE